MILERFKNGSSTVYRLRCECCSREFLRPAHGWHVPASHPIHFCSRSCRTRWLQARWNRNPSGRRVEANGYVSVRIGGPGGKWVAEHCLVAEQKLGRKIKSNEVVHHKDGNRQNNNPENLLVEDRGDHRLTHVAAIRRIRELEMKVAFLEQRIRILERSDRIGQGVPGGSIVGANGHCDNER